MKSRIIAIILAVLVGCFIIWAISTQIREHASQQDSKLHELRGIVAPLFEQEQYYGELSGLNLNNAFERTTLHSGDKSYTINKHQIYLCLKDKEGRYYHNNMLLYVLIHEYAHVVCDEVGHTDKFWRIFEELLILASELGIYNPSIPIMQNYCE